MIINKVVLLPQDVDTLVTADCWGKNYVCVCVSKLLLTLQATRRPMSDTNGFWTMCAWKSKLWFSLKNCIREIHREMTSEKVNMHWSTWPARSAYLGGTRSCNAGGVSTPTCYLDTSVTSPCQTPRTTSVETTTNYAINLEVPRMHSAPRVCTLELQLFCPWWGIT